MFNACETFILMQLFHTFYYLSCDSISNPSYEEDLCHLLSTYGEARPFAHILLPSRRNLSPHMPVCKRKIGISIIHPSSYPSYEEDLCHSLCTYGEARPYAHILLPSRRNLSLHKPLV